MVLRFFLFGPIPAVLHYNCFARCLAILVNRRLGIPTVAYFDDFGPFIPTEIAQEALTTFSGFLTELASELNDRKSDLRAELKFLGLTGRFPQVSTGATLRIFLPGDKVIAWSALIGEFSDAQSISHKKLEKLLGRLSFYPDFCFRSMRPDSPYAITQKASASPLSGIPIRWRAEPSVQLGGFN